MSVNEKRKTNTKTTVSTGRPSLDSCGVLSQMEAVGVVSVLRVCVDQLKILAHTNNKPIVLPNLEYKTLAERFGRRGTKERLIDEETDLPREAVHDLQNMKKLQGDCAFLEVTLSRTADELNKAGTFHYLSSAVIQEMLVSIEEEELLQQELENTNEVEYLKNLIVEEGKRIVDELNQADIDIAKFKDEIQDYMVQNDKTTQYVKNWENARLEQQILKLNMKEHHLHDRLFRAKLGIDIEARVNHEIEEYLKSSEKILRGQIKSWKTRYEKELDERNVELQLLNAEREEHMKELQAINTVYKKRESEIQAYLAVKEEKRQKEVQMFHLNSMATRIQAWWRGVMVRRGLGPYRKKRKAKGKEKKGKGAKKK